MPVTGRTPSRQDSLLGQATVRSLLGGIPSARESGGDALAELAGLVRKEADELDGIAEQLQSLAEYAIDQLKVITEGRDQYRHRSTDGVLQLTGLRIDMLLARRGAAVQHLTALCAAYKQASPPAAVPAPGLAPSPAPARRAARR